MENEQGFGRSIKAFYRHVERHDWVAKRRWFERHREKGVISLIDGSYAVGNSLEIGCGTGLITRHMKNAVGADLNFWAIKRAQQRCPEAVFVVADGEHLPFRNESFSLVVCADVLEHLPYPESAIQEIWRVLSDKGRLIGSVPHSHLLWKESVRAHLTPLKSLEPLHRTYTVRNLSILLATFPQKRLIPDILHVEIFFEAQKAQTTALIQEWDRFWRSQGLLRQGLRSVFNTVFASFVLGKIPRTSRAALEVGVGGGSSATRFRSHGYQVVGADSSLAGLRRAARAHLLVLLCDANALPFRDKSFGLCYSQGLIEHLKSPAVCIEEMRRVSNVVVVSVPREYSPFDLLRRVFEWLGKSWLWPDELYYRTEDLRNIFRPIFRRYWIHTFFGLDLIAIGEDLSVSN